MKKNFILTTQLDFAAAHRLIGYEGDCAKLHGHNWKIEVSVIGHTLNDIGMVIDFKQVKHHAKDVVAELDHSYLNDHPHFQRTNPTAENIAHYLYNELAKRLDQDAFKMHQIRVWENDRNYVTYSETDH